MLLLLPEIVPVQRMAKLTEYAHAAPDCQAPPPESDKT
jgi:hypothetical protein